MHEFIIEWNGFVINIIKKPIKNINLRLTKQKIILSAPLNLSLRKIKDFLFMKQAWIENHVRRLQFEPACTDHFFLGKAYTLKTLVCEQKPQVTIEDDFLYLWLPAGANNLVKKKVLQHWYADEMRHYLPSIIQKWEALIGVHALEWRMRAMKTRWGSCNPIKKSICLNVFLMQRPILCLEYVLVHELVHLLEASHNHRFHALMNFYLPDWKDRKNLLTLKDNRSDSLIIA